MARTAAEKFADFENSTPRGWYIVPPCALPSNSFLELDPEDADAFGTAGTDSESDASDKEDGREHYEEVG